MALLNYPSFFEDAFPALHESWTVDLTHGRVSTAATGIRLLHQSCIEKSLCCLSRSHGVLGAYRDRVSDKLFKDITSIDSVNSSCAPCEKKDTKSSAVSHTNRKR